MFAFQTIQSMEASLWACKFTQGICFWRESPFIPSHFTLFHPTQIREYSQKRQSWKMHSTDSAEHLLCPSYYWTFSSQEQTGAGSKHIPSSPPTHMQSGHQVLGIKGKPALTAQHHLQMETWTILAQRWWAGCSQILQGRMYFLFTSQLSS